MPEDKSKQDYRKVYSMLKKQVKDVESELENLEEDGQADKYPVKHQKALDKIEEINKQIEELDRVLENPE